MEIKYSKQAIKFLNKQDKPTRIRIVAAIHNLPSGDVIKLQGYEGYRLRVGNRRHAMSNVKERIIGAVTVMNEQDANKLWGLIVNTFAEKDWNNIPVNLPDEIDLAMLTDINNDPECHEFVSSEEAMKLLNLQ